MTPTPQEQPDGHTKGLIERLEGARAGDREMDADIYQAFGFEVKRRPQHIRGRSFTRSWAFLRESRWEAMGRLTSSLDDVLSFAAKVGFDPIIILNAGLNHARCHGPIPTTRDKLIRHVCAAILRAKEQAS